MSQKITLRDVRSLKAGQIVWDGSVAGFGARRQKGERISYFVFYRTQEGRQRWFTIGRHGSPWTPHTARDKARLILADVIKNRDPAADRRAVRTATTITTLCDIYMKSVEAGGILTRSGKPKKPSTIIGDRSRVKVHIKPKLGHALVSAVTQDDIEHFRDQVEKDSGRGAATKALNLLATIFQFAVKHKMRADNPARGVQRFADGKRTRRLSEAEYAMLGQNLRHAESENMWPSAVAAARFLALTGWRSGEALKLRRSEVDFDRRTAFLSDSKTGASVRPLSHEACDVLRSVRLGGDLFFSTSSGGIMKSFGPHFWPKLTPAPDITAHTLRHGFASVGNDLGFTDATVGALIGHVGKTMTSRYQHAADKVLLAAADAIAARINELMGESKPSGILVELPVRAVG